MSILRTTEHALDPPSKDESVANYPVDPDENAVHAPLMGIYLPSLSSDRKLEWACRISSSVDFLSSNSHRLPLLSLVAEECVYSDANDRDSNDVS